MHNQKLPAKDRSWWPIIAAAVIGAIATIAAGLVANGAGALHIAVAPAATPTVTITPSPAPAVTVTVSSSASGGAGSAKCLSGQNCKVWNLNVPMGNAGSATGIHFDQGQVTLNYEGDLQFQSASDGAPELLSDGNAVYSVDVTAQTASRQQCQTATNSAPDANPITNFHTGLLFCVATGGNGIALVRQTRPLGSSNILYLQETYWPAAT
jgi:hypothetical protein